MQRLPYEDDIISFDFKDGILTAKYKVKKVDLDIAKYVLEKRLKLFSGFNYTVLADYALVIETSKEARDFFASTEANKYMKALAIVTDSMVGNMIFNFFVLLSRPTIPTKLFKNKDEALFWLKKFE